MIKYITKQFANIEINPYTGKAEDVFEYVEKSRVEVHKPKITASKKKAIASGNIIEIMEYDKEVFRGFESKAKGKKSGNKEKRSDNINKAKMCLRRLINANITPTSKFVTLTYKDNMTDVKKAKDDFKVFIKNMKRNGYAGLKYVYVIEFQDRGAVHFHCVFFNLGYIQSNELSRLWKRGFVKINRIENVDNVGAYVIKYMGKSMEGDDRLNGNDLYGRSRGNLQEPIEITNEKEVSLLQKVYFCKRVYEKTYTSEHLGNITYTQYNLKRE